jgi:hypothetical protein
MKLISALVGLAALGGVALSTGAASAMPVGIPAQSSNIEQAAYVCNGWGHCWWRPDYAYGHPHWGYGGWHHWHHGWGYGGWHHAWGYGGWHRWHHGWGDSGWGHRWRRWHHW